MRNKPYGIRKASSRSTIPVRRFTTEATAIADAKTVSADQGGTEWLVSGPTGTISIRHRHGSAA